MIASSSVSRLVLALAALLAGGCASLEPFTVPEVTLVNVQFEDLTVFETTGTFTVRLSNENPEPVTVDGAVYNLYLDGLKVGKGLSDNRVEVPRLGSAVDKVSVHINNVAVATRLLGLAEGGGLAYTLKGKLYVERPYGLRRLRFARRGRLDLAADQPGEILSLEAAPPGPPQPPPESSADVSG